MSDNQSHTRRRFLGTVGATGAVALAGCSGGSENNAQNDASGNTTTSVSGGTTSSSGMADKIVFYNAGSLQYDPGTAENIKRFEEETGITVEVPEVPWTNLKTSLTTIWRNRSPKVDVWNGPTWWLADFVQSGWLEPLGLPDDQLSKYPDNLTNLVTFDGQAYMAPQLGKWGNFLYDKPYLADNGFDSPPETWDDVVTMSTELTTDSKSGFGFTWGNKDVFTFKQFLYQAGGQLFDGNEPVFTEKGKLVFDFITRLRENGALPNGISSMGEGGVGDAFVADQFAMAESWTPLGSRVLGSDGWDKSRLGSAKPPKGPGGSRATFQDTNGIGVSAYSKRKGAAKKFAQFMSTQQSAKTDMLIEGNPAVIPEVYEDSEIRSKYPSDLLEDMKYNLQHAKSETYLAQPQVDDYLSEQITPALLGDKDPATALKDAESNIRSLYKNIGLL